MQIRTHSAVETRSLGHALGRLLEPGDFLALSGGLGSGKTVLIQGVVRGVGYEGPVVSPSYVIVNEYTGRLPVLHVDLYRIEDPQSLADLGLREIFWSDGVTLVEWADRATSSLPPGRLDVALAVSGPSSRDLVFRAHGPRAERLLSSLSAGSKAPFEPQGERPKEGP